MSLRLSDRVANAMEAHWTPTGCKIADAAAELANTFDENEVLRAKLELASKLLRSAASRALIEIASAPAGQGVLPFRLHSAYPLRLDEDGQSDRKFVNTYDMTRHEAAQALNIRDLQIAADTRSRNDLARAISAASPIWDKSPDLSFGQALELAAAKAGAAA